MDQEKLKELLVSEDVDMLVELMLPYAESLDDDCDNPKKAEQLCKMQILVWSRVMHLSRENADRRQSLLMAYQNLGRCWMMLGDTEKALGQLNKALDVERTFQVLQLLSDLHLNDSNYQDAIKHEEEALELASSDKERLVGYTKLGTILQAQGEFEKAVEVYQKGGALSEIDKGSEICADLHSKLGTLHEQMGNYQEAVDELKYAVESLTKLYGAEDSRTEEVAYMLEVATTFLE